MKYFRMSYEEVVYKRSFLTIMLLNRSIPTFDTENEKDTTKPKIGKSKWSEEPIKDDISAVDFFQQLF